MTEPSCKGECTQCRGCALRQACCRACVPPPAAQESRAFDALVYAFYTLLAFCVIRYGITPVSVSMHLRPDYDANIYHLIGSAWMEGMLPYVTLSDLKGPLIFLEYGLGSLLAPDSFLGVSILNALVVGLGFLYAWKCASLFVGRYAGLAASGVLFVYTLYFSAHPSVNVLTLQYISLYYVLRAMLQGKSCTGWPSYAAGAFVGLVLLLKFNLAAFWLPVGLYMLFGERGWGKRLLQMVAGLLAVLLPAVVYMSCVGMLGAFWEECVLTSVCYGSAGWAESALVQRGWELLSQVMPDHLYIHAPLWLTASLGSLLAFPWLVLPQVVRIPRPGVYYSVLGSTWLLCLVANFGGAHHFLHYFFSFMPFVMLSLVVWLRLLMRIPCLPRLKRLVVATLVALPLPVALVAAATPFYVDACRQQLGISQSRQATAALVEHLRGHSFVCTDHYHTLLLYRLAGQVPPIRHLVPQMTPQGYSRYEQEMLELLRTNPPRFVVCTPLTMEETELLLHKAGVHYRRVELAPPTYPEYPPKSKYPPFCLLELVKH